MALAQENLEKYSSRVMGLSILESLVGLIVVALAIIGLARVAPVDLVSVATIIVGCALLFQGGVQRIRFTSLSEEMGHRGFESSVSVIEFIAGVVAIVFGILSVFDYAPRTLIPISAIIIGVAFLIQSSMGTRLDALETTYYGASDWNRQMNTTLAGIAGNVLGLVGFAAIALGIIALTGVVPIILSLIAILSIGAVHIIHGTAVARMSRGVRQEIRPTPPFTS